MTEPELTKDSLLRKTTFPDDAFEADPPDHATPGSKPVIDES